MDRRLAAIVAADVVNYSALLRENDLGAVNALNQLHNEVFHPSVTRYRGRTIRFTGDGSIVAFDSAHNAVNFAFDVQRVMAERKSRPQDKMRIDFRIGANVGDVIEDPNNLHGEGINVAVRLEELAPPGGICLSDGIYRQTRNAFGEELLPIGERQLKNIADPVFVWRWQPPRQAGFPAAPITEDLPPKFANGRQILDPKVTSSLIDLFMRSARLALRDAFEEMLLAARGGKGLPSPNEIRRTISEKLAEAGEPLFPIFIQKACDQRLKGGQRRHASQGMSDFMAGLFNNGDIVMAASMARRIQAILASGRSENDKRTALLQLGEALLRAGDAAAVRRSIRFAYVEL